MKLVFSSYGDEGDLSRERFGFKVVQDCNLKFYIAYLTGKTDGGFFNRPSNVFWFYPKSVKAGDEVVLYTKEGVDSSEVQKDGHTVHFIFWGLDKAVIKKGDCLVLSEVDSWSVTKFDKEK